MMKNKKYYRFFALDEEETLFGRVEDYTIGYCNEDYTYIFTEEDVRKYFGVSIDTGEKLDKYKMELQMARILDDDELIEKLEKKYNIDISDFMNKSTVIYKEKPERAYYYQRGSIVPYIKDSIDEYCEDGYEPEYIYIGDDKNGYSGFEPEWLWNFSDIRFEAEFIKDIDKDLQLWKIEKNNYIVLKEIPPTYQTEKTDYKIVCKGTLKEIEEKFSV